MSESGGAAYDQRPAIAPVGGFPQVGLLKAALEPADIRGSLPVRSNTAETHGRKANNRVGEGSVEPGAVSGRVARHPPRREPAVAGRGEDRRSVRNDHACAVGVAGRICYKLREATYE